MKIALVAMSAKPYHAGHDGLVRIAAAENDEVKLFVSLADRKRPGEIPIMGADMKQIWTRLIEPSLPANVDVSYVASPVRSVYEALGAANEANDDETLFRVYGDPTDIAQNFPEKSLDKYAGGLQQRGQIELVPTKRTSTVNVSGTKMRQYLESGDEASFVKNMPPAIDGRAVWSILSRRVAEGLLRGYAELVTTSRPRPSTRTRTSA